jgi:predicted phage terminase large subunit-like protein
MVGGAVTGFHAHFIIVDDPLDPKRAASEADLKSANDWMRETLPTRKVDQSICPTILIMQRLHQNDPTGEWLERTKGIGIKHICLPAEDAMSVSPSILRTEYIDGLLDPVRMSKKILEDARRELGEYGFSAQYDQTPIPRGGGEFKIDRIVLEERPKSGFLRRVRYWDKAGTRGGGCYTAGVLLGVDKNKCFWILDVVRGQWDAFERERIIRLTAEADGRQVEIGIEQEPGSGGLESAQNTVRNLAGFTVFKDRPTGDKATRADPFIVQVNGGNVRMLKGEWNRDYLNELLYWPNSKYKDQVDASSGAFLRLCHVKRRIGAL